MIDYSTMKSESCYIRQVFFLAIPLLVFAACNTTLDTHHSSPRAIAGVMDLRDFCFDKDRPISLRGEWEFYWEQLVSMSDSNGSLHPEISGYAYVPGAWNGIVVDGRKIGGSGFATYRLRILLGQPGTGLAIQPGTIASAYRLYINGELLGGQGQVGTTGESSLPLFLQDTIIYPGSDEILDIVLQISNFNHRKGGPWDKMDFGSLAGFLRRKDLSRDFDHVILGALFFMGFFYLGLLLTPRNNGVYLSLSLFCFTIGLRTTLQNGVGYLGHLIPGLSWEFINKLEYITLYLALPLFMYYAKTLFKEKILLKALKSVSVISAAFVLFTLLTSSLIHSWLIPAYQLILLVSGILLMVLFVKNALGKDIFAKSLLLPAILIFAAVINDTLYAAGFISSIYLISYGILLFILIQAYVLSIRFIYIYNSVDRQKKQLIKTNKQYKSEINIRINAEKSLVNANENLLLARSAIILGLAKMAESRDSDTGAHLARIQEYARRLATELAGHQDYRAYITPSYVSDLYESSILHDIGQIGIPDGILLKPGKLTTQEFEIIKRHPGIGGDTIKSIETTIHELTFLTLGREIAYMHHEKWDGSGYPNGTTGLNIPLSARIIALVDVYDALTSRRCYKDAFPHEDAVAIIKEQSGTHFDPTIVAAFLSIHTEFDRLRYSL